MTYFTKHNTLGASTLLQMVEFHYFLWLSIIPMYVCVYTPYHLSPLICLVDIWVAIGLHYCAQAFSSCGEQGLLS